MNIQDLQGKLVAVLGYGQEGKAVTHFLLKNGIQPTLFDAKLWQNFSEQEQDEIKNLKINFIFGPDWLNELKGFDIAFRSPGVPLSKIKIDNLLITSQTKWFFEHCPGKIIGITGTKGKGTTSALIYEMLKLEDKKAYLTGNIGKVQPLEILDGLTKDDFIVYELSSFQLQDLAQSPHIAVVLMVTSEHMDYHAHQAEYIEAKASITKFQKTQDFAIINADYQNSKKIGALGNGKKLFFSRQGKADCFVRGGAIVAGTGFQLSLSNLQLRGAHNLENICAAILAALSVGVSDESIKHAACEFKGLEHRLEFVAQKGGVKFYNDSFSTTPETAIAAIKAFSEPLVIILGGSAKNSDFTELGKAINQAKNLKKIILVGEEAPKIKTLVKSQEKILEGAKNMAEIFEQIKTVAAKGDTVLLSPACASFGMFQNYKDRGSQFKKAALNF